MSSLLLSCPRGSQAMSLVSVVGVTIDACYRCKIAYFDRGEFSQVCANPAAFSRAMTPAATRESSLVWDAVVTAPDPTLALDLTAAGANAAGDVALRTGAHVAEVANTDVATAASAAGEASLGAAAALAERR
jgi:Zn-finger nucleic acid-binding protein